MNMKYENVYKLPFQNLRTTFESSCKQPWVFINLLIFCGFFSIFPTQAQFLKADGKYIVDGNDEEIILRGMGLGGWMLQEGYMLQTNSFANPQHEIRAAIEGVIGEENTDEFYAAWLENHCTKTDIDSLASWGFNSVRLPMHYNLFTLPIEDEPVAGQNTWLEKGFAMTDSLLNWCAANEIYLILDLHAAPGGQGNDAAISDYDNSKPSLWESDANKQKTIALWKKLAERYANEKWIGGYDLINETNWNFTAGANQNGCDESTNAPLKALFIAITDAIREVDENHIIFIEGNCWANNHNGIWPPWDDNLVISFHKYWNYNDQNSIQGFINMRNEHNIPVWLGESGENSNTWFKNAISLLEKNKIGWAWWPLKKVGSVVGPLTINKNEGYAELLDYWENGGNAPSVEEAKAALMQLTEDLKIENCTYHKDVIDAMFRQVQQTEATSIPFTEISVPGVVSASDFDLGGNGIAYFDNDTANYNVATGTYQAWNQGWTYRNDGVDIEATTDTTDKSNGYNIGWTADGEWLQYTITVDSTGSYQLNLRYGAMGSESTIRLQVDGVDIIEPVKLPSTGGYNVWQTYTIENVPLTVGTQKLKLIFKVGGLNLGYLDFDLAANFNEIPFAPTYAATTEEGDVFFSLNKSIDTTELAAIAGFSITADGNEVEIESIEVEEGNNKLLVFYLNAELNDGMVLKASYDGDVVKATDGTSLEAFTDFEIINNLPFHYALPAKVEAENFTTNYGLELETTTDTGGGQNIGYTNYGDYLEYLISVEEESDFKVEVRVASESAGGKLALKQLDNEGEVLNEVEITVPVTGGWQTWQTVSEEMHLDAGRGILKLEILQPEFNVNWINFKKQTVSGIGDKTQGSLNLYPNPVNSAIRIELPNKVYTTNNSVTICTVQGKVIYKKEQLKQQDFEQFSIETLQAGLYILKLNMGDSFWSGKILIDK